MRVRRLSVRRGLDVPWGIGCGQHALVGPIPEIVVLKCSFYRHFSTSPGANHVRGGPDLILAISPQRPPSTGNALGAGLAGAYPLWGITIGGDS